MRPLPNRFQEYHLDKNEEELAQSVSPYFYAFLQNKAAAYASAVVEYQYDMSKELVPQVIEHEKLKAQVIVLEELMREVNPPIESQDSSTPTPN
jgi:hypothetical protein